MSVNEDFNPFAFEGLTYDDVLLLPGPTDVIPSDANTATKLSKRITLNVPILSAAMDTVTEAPMAIALARQGGIGIIHRNISIEDQAKHVDQVKRSESGMITDPVTIAPDATLRDLDDLCAHYRVSGLPVVDENRKLLGIITNRDTRFVPRETWATTKVVEKMTSMPLITAPVGTTREKVFELLAENRIEKLPLVDEHDILQGLITVKDFDKAEDYPLATKDD
ncbi:MAG: IMP dehydrogenase, partial [Galactobacter sp.]